MMRRVAFTMGAVTLRISLPVLVGAHRDPAGAGLEIDVCVRPLKLTV